GDGLLDIVLTTRGAGGIQIFLNQGGGRYPPRGTATLLPERILADPVVVDMNGDGRPDLLVLDKDRLDFNEHSEAVLVVLNEGGGRFSSTPLSFSLGQKGESHITAGDLNGDGLPEIVATQT